MINLNCHFDVPLHLAIDQWKIRANVLQVLPNSDLYVKKSCQTFFLVISYLLFNLRTAAKHPNRKRLAKNGWRLCIPPSTALSRSGMSLAGSP
jgi:hypothetical protein